MKHPDRWHILVQGAHDMVRAGSYKVCRDRCPQKDRPVPSETLPLGAPRPRTSPGGCCSNCTTAYLGSVAERNKAMAHGYFPVNQDPEKPWVVLDNTKAHGWWRPKKGCVLPRNLRPEGCLAAYCYALETHAPKAVAIIRLAYAEYMGWEPAARAARRDLAQCALPPSTEREYLAERRTP